jgi:hypothetical protein
MGRWLDFPDIENYISEPLSVLNAVGHDEFLSGYEEDVFREECSRLFSIRKLFPVILDLTFPASKKGISFNASAKCFKIFEPNL